MEQSHMERLEKLFSNPSLTDQFLFGEIYKLSLVEGKLLYLGMLLKRAACLYKDRVALIYKDREVSYKQLYYYAVNLSKKIQNKGIKKGDRVLLLFENSIEFYVGYFAILQVGAIVAPLNTFLKPRELLHIITDASPALMVVSDTFVKRLQEVDGSSLPPMITENEIDINDKVPEQLPEFEVICQEPDQLAALLYTSGTTGFPKGVMLSSKNIITNIIQGLARIRMLGKGERLFGVLPLFHSFAQFACVWAPFFMGATVIVVPKIERRAIWHGLKKHPTIFLGVPALYGLLCLLRKVPLDSVKYFISGGDALPDKIRAAFGLIYRRKICSGYGLTETSPLISIELEDLALPTNTVGRPVAGIECEVRDLGGNPISKHEIGQLWVKGDNVMLGYYNAPELSKKVLKNGWFDTGDLVYFDQKGRIVISGRLKELIIHKGFNIYPQEIENVIVGHPNVLFAGVIGKKDPDVGELPIAFVQLRVEQETICDELKELCKTNLAPYKVPKEFICTAEELPKTATGKVDKKVLRIRLDEKG